MTDRMQKNLWKYGGWGALSVAIAVLTALLTQLNGTGDIVWRPIIAAAISATLGVLTMALSSMRLTRVGSEDIGAQVDALRESGVHRRDMTVLPKAEAATMAAGVPPIHPEMTPDETDRLLTLIRAVGPEHSIATLTAALDDERRTP